MIEMDDGFIEDNDLDWFACYQDGYLAHFTSGGTPLVPQLLRESIINYEKLYDYFWSLDKRYQVEIVEENLPIFSDEKQKSNYLKSFVDMASRGLFSYNIDYTNKKYILIAKPLKKIKLDDLPIDIKKIIYTLPDKITSSLKVIEQVE